ncbi:BamA/TamA family outer membrane protein [Haliangium sp.]|uniref:BamA/TamA family outer membrane protein n=1 Tax=Haliangium sp. TaxID=2663208 RepID=UPI003D137855
MTIRSLVLFSTAVLVVAATWSSRPVLAQEIDSLPHEDEQTARESRAAALDPEFGPRLLIEDIKVTGNTATATRLILRALPIAPGDTLRAGDPRFRQARFKLLATGYFRDVTVALAKGSAPGRVVLTVTVVERGTVILNSLHFGTSAATPWWAGLDLSEGNLLGTGIGVGLGGMYAAKSDIEGARSQRGLELRVSDPALLGSRFSAHGRLYHARASEPVRARAAPADATLEDYCTLPYARWGGRAGVGMDFDPLSQLNFELRVERVESEHDPAPGAPACALADGTAAPGEVGLEPGRSRVVSVSVGFDRDTRPDPILPYAGDRLVLLAELGSESLGSSYGFTVLLARYSRWWTVRGKRHVLSLHLAGGGAIGRPPRFDELHAADFDRLLAPRAYGLLVSTTVPPDAFSTGADALGYGGFGASATVEYSYRLFRRPRLVYGGDLFVGAGLWGMSPTRREPERLGDAAVPIDVMVDAGLRVDTELGVFELTFANALGRVPL